MSDPHAPQGPRQPHSPDSAERAWELPEPGAPGAPSEGSPQGYQGPTYSTPSYGTPSSGASSSGGSEWSPAGEQGGTPGATAEQGSYGTSDQSPAADPYAPTVGGEPSAGASYSPQTGAGSMAADGGGWSQPQPGAGPYAQQQPWSQPSANPYGQPQSQPSAGPYGHPQSQPSASPYGQPQSQPSVGPYGHPQSQPSADGYGQQWAGQGYGQQAQPGPYPGAVPAGGVAPGQVPVRPDEEKLWGTLTHVGMIVTGFIGPLIVYLMYKDRSQWIRANAAQSLNFSILISIVYVVSLVLMTVGIGFITYFAAGICAIIFGILAAMAANRGEFYKYPLNVSWVK
ncbi:DUF4870 domain-containing protein [Auraticoccus monumenti]|uniref:Uncharacterized conserved protein, Tic20 family n=1 Tax=Auraticoccus monumenti TaxID=675864 RepID=A0A1G6W8T9_9ACTN|nr:DUF4870 domain-containing protein [Auraticoccus monumenti]SDD62228.1 Uncharacterized conserved protein, Tic20 family [Auraticoccus monumenti]